LLPTADSNDAHLSYVPEHVGAGQALKRTVALLKASITCELDEGRSRQEVFYTDDTQGNDGLITGKW